jgi:HK97 family phage prohead protease
MTKREVRFGESMEIRQGPGGSSKLVGYAAVFNSLSHPIRGAGTFRERIAPGAFRNSIGNKDDVRALVNHDSSRIIGRTKAGTLRLTEDRHGLRCEIDPPNTSIGRDLVESVRRGDLDQMSFGFTVVSDDWTNENGQTVRELRDVQLFDVSVVAYPAYEASSVALRSLMFPDGAPDPPNVCNSEQLRLRSRLELAKRIR